MHKTVLTIDNSTPVFIGYRAPNKHWNGWSMPYFDLTEATKVAADYNKTAEFPMYYDPIYDQFYTWDGDNNDYYIIKGCDYHTTDGIKHLYSIGAGCWVWDEVSGTDIRSVAQQAEELLYYYTAHYDYAEDDPQRYQTVNTILTQLTNLNTLAQVMNIIRLQPTKNTLH